MSGWYYPKSSPKPVKNGIAVSSKRGAIGEQWWSKRFLEALNRMGMENRLARGRTYARKGQVIRLDAKEGGVEAAVQGSSSKPYSITISLKQWDKKGWNSVISAIADQALYSAQMLSGEMPHEIEAVVEKAGFCLFPKNGTDLRTTCSCPDYANPCKHIAAVYYILAERFDMDPFLIFEMRGKDKEELLEALRIERGGGEEEKLPEPAAIESPVPEITASHFFTMRTPADRFPVHLTREAEVKGGLFRSLGPSPCMIGKENVSDILSKVYEIAPAYVSWLVHGTESHEQDEGK